MAVAIISAASLLLLVSLLGFHVSNMRVKHKVITGMTDDPTSPVDKAVRAHVNNAEYAGVLMAVMLYLGMMEPALWVQIVIVIVAASRWLMALGFLVCETLAKPHPFKITGSLITYIGGPVLAVAAVLTVL